MSKNKSKPTPANHDPDVRDDDEKGTGPDSSEKLADAIAGQDDSSEDNVKLTDISDIVAKYAVVDKVFNDDEDEDIFDDIETSEEIDAADEPDAVDEPDEAEDVPPIAARRITSSILPERVATETDLPERPKIVFRRPKMMRDELWK